MNNDHAIYRRTASRTRTVNHTPTLQRGGTRFKLEGTKMRATLKDIVKWALWIASAVEGLINCL